jgi:hypothetical protein
LIHSQRIIEVTADVRIAKHGELACSYVRDESCDEDIRVCTVFVKVDPIVAYSRVRFRGNQKEIATYKLTFFADIQNRHLSLFDGHEHVRVVDFSNQIPVDQITGLYGVSETVAAVARCGI